MHMKPSPASTIGGMALLALSALCLLTGCPRSPEATESTGKEVVIFVDFSDSIRGDNHLLLLQDLQRAIVPTLSAGDRIVIAPINDKTFTGFHSIVEVTFPDKPAFDGWTDNLLKHNQEVKRVDAEVARLKEEIGAKITGMFKGRTPSQQTDIFSSILMAQKLFNQQRRQKVLVLMSDMIVDYPPYRFERIAWTPEKTAEILSDLRTKGMIPDLSQVCVYVSGVTAASADQAGSIARFWQEYFEQTNANLDSSRYAHVLLHWPPNPSCDSQGRDLPPGGRAPKEQAALENAGAQDADQLSLLAP